MSRIWSLRRLTPLPARVIARFLCALGVFVAIGFSATRSLEQVVAIGRWMSDAHRAVEQLHAPDAAVRAAESAHRGFVATGSEDHLIAFNDTQSTAMRTPSHVVPCPRSLPTGGCSSTFWGGTSRSSFARTRT